MLWYWPQQNIVRACHGPAVLAIAGPFDRATLAAPFLLNTPTPALSSSCVSRSFAFEGWACGVGRERRLYADRGALACGAGPHMGLAQSNRQFEQGTDSRCWQEQPIFSGALSRVVVGQTAGGRQQALARAWWCSSVSAVWERCQASAEQSRDSVFPVPVGLSRRAWVPSWSASSTRSI